MRLLVIEDEDRLSGILKSKLGDVDGEADFAELGLQNTGEAIFILDDQKTQR